VTDEEKQEIDDNARTIRPTRSPSSPGMTIPLAKPPSTDIGPIVEDYSDLAVDEDDEQLLGKVADFRVRLLYPSFPTSTAYHAVEQESVAKGSLPPGRHQDNWDCSYQSWPYNSTFP
jgi:hypothetical protein